MTFTPEVISPAISTSMAYTALFSHTLTSPRASFLVCMPSKLALLGLQINGSIAILIATGSSAELGRQDRLFSRQDHSRATAVYPRSLDNVIEGQVLAVPEGLRKAGFLDIVALNRGTRHSLSKGATMGGVSSG